MPINKNAYRRYNVIDSCLRNKMRPYPSMNDLLDAIKEKLDVMTTAETVQKDIAVMKMLPPDGFDAPIKFNRSTLGYEYTDPDFSIYGVALNSSDIDAINEAIEVLESIGGSRVSEKFTHAIEKVLSNAQEQLNEADQGRKIIQTDQVSESRGFENFDLLYAACRDRVCIQFNHYSYSSRTFQSCTVHPVLLKEFDNHWYVIGYSETHGALRTFGLDRIYEPIPIRKIFKDTTKEIIEEYLNDVYGVYPLKGSKKERIELKLNSMITNYFRAQKIHPSQEIEIMSNGNSIVSFELIPSMELVMLISSYGSQVRVLKPKHLIKTIHKYNNE